MVLDPQRWLEFRRFRALFESGAVTLTEVAKETGLNRKTVRKYLSGQAPAASREGCRMAGRARRRWTRSRH
jgi:predicted transcriptional regulator